MRVFVAGATGVLGLRLVPLLLTAGHTVAGLSRSRSDILIALGAESVACDVYDLASLSAALRRFEPDVVLHQLTQLPDDPGELEVYGAAHRRMRDEGTRNLLSAAAEARMIAQSIAFPPGAPELEERILSRGGVVLRYGRWYGPGTWYESDPPEAPRIHIDAAARETLVALTLPPGTLLELVDDPD